MPNPSETTHARNVNNFAILVQACESFGPAYNPSRKELQLPALQESLQMARQYLLEFHTINATNNLTIAARHTAFEGFSKKITRIYHALKACDVSEEVKLQTRLLVRRLQGRRASAPTPAPPDEKQETPRGHSVSHLAYDTRLNVLNQLVQLLSQTPQYNPNEVDLTVTALQAWEADLIAKHQAVLATEAMRAKSRNTRNEGLYQKLHGLPDLAANIKSYIRSVFGSASGQYKQVSGLRFQTMV